MQRFELLGRNGAGANSTVFKCRDIASGAVVAVKKLEGASMQQILQEAAIMRACAHKHCVELLEAHQGTASGAVYLVMENIEHSLARELLLNPRGLPLPKSKLIAFQLAQALELVHSKQVAHGDMKPANILLTAQYSVKLCDFGSATSAVLNDDADDAAAGLPPTPGPPASPGGPDFAPGARVTAAASRWYCAPESLLGVEGSAASDVWALGCILAELVTGKPLMPGSEEQLSQLCCVASVIGHLSEAQEQLLQLLPREQRAKLEEARARGPLLEKIPKVAACPALAAVLRACLQPDPARRPTAQQLQAMTFFEDLRHALQASEAAAAAVEVSKAAHAHLVTAAARGASPQGSIGVGAGCSPLLKRRTSSCDMDVDTPAGTITTTATTDSPSPCAAALPAAPAAGSTTGSATASAAGSPPLQPPRRTGGVQAAAPMRPPARARVSALTATIRGKPFEGDGGYTDLMPLVLRLVARWETIRADAAFGPIAMAARGTCSTSPAASAASARSGDLLALGGCWPSAGTAGGNGSNAAAAAAAALCTTPIAAAAGGCGSARAAPIASPAAATAPTASPMDCSPAAPATASAAAPSARLSIPLSASVGAVPYMAKAAGLVSVAAIAAAAARPSPTQLRSRAIINRARRHHSREPRAGSVPTSYLASSSCPRTGLGASATLLQQELASAVGSGPMPSRHNRSRSPCHSARRSFADLSDLASVAEYAPLQCETPPDVKRRRGLAAHHLSHTGLHPAQPSVGSFNSLLTETTLGSLPEHEPFFGRVASGAAASGGGRRMRRSSSGTGLTTGSPVRPGGWQHMLTGDAATAARAVSLPQPIGGRSRCAAPARGGSGLAVSVSSDVNHNSGTSEAYLRKEVV